MESPIAQPESPYEILRRLENIVRAGTIAAVRHGKPARCRVRTGNLTTNWVPWLAQRAGGARGRHWWPPAVGEQCLLIAPGGDLLNAVALPGIYSDAMAQGSESEHACRTDWEHGDHMQYDGAERALRIVVGDASFEMSSSLIRMRVGSSTFKMAEGKASIQAGGGTFIVDGRGVYGGPDVRDSMGIVLSRHAHTNVRPGDGMSGPPFSPENPQPEQP